MTPVFAQEAPEIHFEPIFDGVDFSSPIEVAFAPGEDERIYIVERAGRIQAWEEGTGAPTEFLDITDRVDTFFEGGLLGLAFSSDYESSGVFYVNYTTTSNGQFRTHVSRFLRSSTNPPEADPATEDTLLVVDQPAGNHNAGKIAFGPDDYLYIALGDGGGSPGNRSQDLSDVLGSLLRIDVISDPEEEETYVIPPDNPFVNTPGAQPEIYAYGFRNPFRFSFDSETSDLWLGDVGQSTWEEIDIVEPGGNYGWAEMEGPECYQTGCNPDLYAPPVFWYSHSQGCSVTGGSVYRGTEIPDLVGHYLFSDYCSGQFWMLEDDGQGGYESVTLSDEVGSIASINERPSDSEVFVTSLGGGVYQVIPANDTGGPPAPDPVAFDVVGPNPTRDRTRVRIRVDKSSEATLRLVDSEGRDVATLFAGTLTGGVERNLTVNTNDLPPGAYFVILDRLSERRTRRFVVVK